MEKRTPRAAGGAYVYEALRQEIITQQLAPGVRLSEASIATRLNVSRTPVREGFNKLLSEGLLRQLPTGGMVVPDLDVEELDRLYVAREALEGAIARQAALHATPVEIAKMAATVHQIPILFDDEAEVYRLGAELHALIAAAARNEYCEQFLHQLRGHIDRYRSISNSSRTRRKAATDEHIALYEAIAAHDGDVAEHIARQHVRGAGIEARLNLSGRFETD